MLTSVCQLENLDLCDLFENDPIAIEKSLQKLVPFYSKKLVEIVRELLGLNIKNFAVFESRIENMKGDNILDDNQLIVNMNYGKISEEFENKKLTNIIEDLSKYFELEMYDKIIQVFNRAK